MREDHPCRGTCQPGRQVVEEEEAEEGEGEQQKVEELSETV